jgi:hypothetical protein
MKRIVKHNFFGHLYLFQQSHKTNPHAKELGGGLFLE